MAEIKIERLELAKKIEFSILPSINVLGVLILYSAPDVPNIFFIGSMRNSINVE